MLRQLKIAITSVLAFTLLFGLAFPLGVTGLARLVFPHQAAGSLVTRDGHVVGSRLIAQAFGGAGYDAGASGGTNLGPTSDKLIHGVHRKLANGADDPANFDGIGDLAAAYRSENGLAPGTPVPADAVTRSASGLDPDISPANAQLQIPRVAAARGLLPQLVRQLVDAHTESRQLGFLGEPRVNVLELNLALDEAGRGARVR